MSETAEANRAMERRNRIRLTSAAAVAVLCVLAIMALRLAQRSVNAVLTKRRADEP